MGEDVGWRSQLPMRLCSGNGCSFTHRFHFKSRDRIIVQLSMLPCPVGILKLHS